MSTAVEYAEQALLAAHQYGRLYHALPGAVAMNPETHQQILADAQLAKAQAIGRDETLFGMRVVVSELIPPGEIYALPVYAEPDPNQELPAAERPTGDIVCEIDQLIDEQMRRGDSVRPAIERCPNCNRPWHGLAITTQMEEMRKLPHKEQERALAEYSYKKDTSDVICPGSMYAVRRE